jgi:hypothetical protein
VRRVVRLLISGFAIGVCLLAVGGGNVAAGADPAAHVATLEQFPPADAGVDLAGELVAVDHLLRRGGLRLDGDFNEDRYRWSPTFSFMLLPYGTVTYHGGPADLNDVPVGTRLQGRFLLPPKGDTAIAPPLEHHMRLERFVPAHNRAGRLEDDFSHAVRTGRAWKLQGLDREKGVITVVAVTAAGQPVADAKPVVHSIDASTRIWKGAGFGTLDDLVAAAAAAAVVQVNLTWAPGWENRQFHASDVWLDEASRQGATARQREIHRRRTLHYGLPARIERVEHTGGGNGVVTVTLLAGYDPEIYEEFFDNGGLPGRMATGVGLHPVEPSLRIWETGGWGSVAKRRTVENPLPGSSGIELDISTNLLLEGYRPGRYVRLSSRTGTWPKSKLPPEVRIKWHEETDQALYGPEPKPMGEPLSQRKQ